MKSNYWKIWYKRVKSFLAVKSKMSSPFKICCNWATMLVGVLIGGGGGCSCTPLDIITIIGHFFKSKGSIWINLTLQVFLIIGASKAILFDVCGYPKWDFINLISFFFLKKNCIHVILYMNLSCQIFTTWWSIAR